MITFYIITACPEVFPGHLSSSILGRALGKSWDYKVINLRDYGVGKHKKIDDTVYGGGPGLVIRPDVIGPAIDDIISVVKIDAGYYLSPKGILLNQEIVKEICKSLNIILLCGRFEGIDERIIKRYNLIEISIGDYILSNGDIAAMVMMDSIIRLLPGVLGNEESHKNDSFSDGYSYDYPVYTKPLKYCGLQVPDVLTSGNHKEISKWRKNH